VAPVVAKPIQGGGGLANEMPRGDLADISRTRHELSVIASHTEVVALHSDDPSSPYSALTLQYASVCSAPSKNLAAPGPATYLSGSVAP
jgi:hypothetical protein